MSRLKKSTSGSDAFHVLTYDFLDVHTYIPGVFMRRTEDTGSALCLQRDMHKAGDELGEARKQASKPRSVDVFRFPGDRARTEERATLVLGKY